LFSIQVDRPYVRFMALVAAGSAARISLIVEGASSCLFRVPGFG
jgi:hypothetical protein